MDETAGQCEPSSNDTKQGNRYGKAFSSGGRLSNDMSGPAGETEMFLLKPEGTGIEKRRDKQPGEGFSSSFLCLGAARRASSSLWSPLHGV